MYCNSLTMSEMKKAENKISAGMEETLTHRELRGLMREEWNKYQKRSHYEDCMTLQDYESEFVGSTFHTFKVCQDSADESVYFRNENNKFNSFHFKIV